MFNASKGGALFLGDKLMPNEIAVRSKPRVEQFQDRSSHLVASLEIEMFRARRYDRPLSIVCFNVSAARENGAGFLPINVEKRLRRLGPKMLRMPDFWGRVDRLGFLIVLPETPVSGAQAFVRRLVTVASFAQLLDEERKRTNIALGAAGFEDGIDSVDDFVAAASANIVWPASAGDASDEPSEDPTPEG